MAIMDALYEFSDAQALASISSGSSTVSTNVTDMGANGEDGWGNALTTKIGQGGQLVCNLTLAAALVGASAAIIATLVTKASSASISSGATEIGRATIAATAAAGNRYTIPVPPGDTQRYIGVLYTASGGKLTSATVNAWIGHDTAVNMDLTNG